MSPAALPVPPVPPAAHAVASPSSGVRVVRLYDDAGRFAGLDLVPAAPAPRLVPFSAPFDDFLAALPRV